MLAYAWKSPGWFLAGAAVALGFLLVPLQVAAERKKLDRTVTDIAQAQREIRALAETEFDTAPTLPSPSAGTATRCARSRRRRGSSCGTRPRSPVRRQRPGATIQTAALDVPAPLDGSTMRPAITPAVATNAIETRPAKAETNAPRCCSGGRAGA